MKPLYVNLFDSNDFFFSLKFQLCTTYLGDLKAPRLKKSLHDSQAINHFSFAKMTSFSKEQG